MAQADNTGKPRITPAITRRQAFDLLPGRPFFTTPEQQQCRRNRREQGPAQAVEQWMEFLHDDSCEGQGEAEDHNAEQAKGHAGVFAGGHDGNQNRGGWEVPSSSHKPRGARCYS